MFFEIIGPRTTTFFASVVDTLNGAFVKSDSGMLHWIFVFLGLIFAVTIHEFFHAFTANELGDDTPKLQNRLNINPLNHFDLIGAALLFLTHFSYGKPVLVNPNNFKNPPQGNFLVALAGPVSNILQAALCIVAFTALKHLPVYA